MTTTSRTQPVACKPGALPGGLVRARYFDGMFLRQADLEDEQTYWRMKRRLTNRALGQGVVWGLRLVWDGGARRFRLGPGYALDCCGNDLVVECPTEAAERELVERSAALLAEVGQANAIGTRRCPKPPSEAGPTRACVVLQYVECPEDPRPIHRDACSMEVERCEPARVRETTRLLLVPEPAPQPPGPVEEFCRELGALREGETASGAPDLFPAPGQTAEGALPLTVVVAVGSAMESSRPEANEIVAGHMSLPVGTSIDLQFELRPDSGWAFTEGSVVDAAGATLAQIVPPHSLALTFPVHVELTPKQEATFEFEAKLRMATLFGDEPAQRLAVHCRATAHRNTDPDALRTTELDWRITSEVEIDASQPPTEESCCDALRDGPFLGDARCTLRALVLSALYGWLRCGIPRAQGKTIWSGPRLLASWIYTTSWHLLLGSDPASARRAELTQLLERLFAAWCRGSLYPGPRCRDAHHGVVLGCVELSPKGDVLSFDPWKHRRHVLTGPLLAHWGEQLGLAPIDLVAGRFFRWACCVADLGRATGKLGTTGRISIAERNLPAAAAVSNELGVLPIDGGELHVGKVEALEAALKERGLSEQGKETVGWIGFLTLLRELLTAGPRPTQGRARRVFTLEGAGLHLVVPTASTAVAPPAAGGRLAELARRVTAPMNPLAREAGTKLVLELAAETPIADLRPPAGAKNFRAFVDRLSEQGVASVADLLELGPEPALDLMRATPDWRQGFSSEVKAIETVDRGYAGAEELLGRLAETLVARSGAARALRREELAQPDLVEELVDASSTVLANKLDAARTLEVARRIAGSGAR